MLDESKLRIGLTLWGENASKEGLFDGNIIALRGAKVSDYGGKSLNSGWDNNSVMINIEHKRTQ